MIRAAAGGLGAAKTGANYAASLLGARLAREAALRGEARRGGRSRGRLVPGRLGACGPGGLRALAAEGRPGPAPTPAFLHGHGRGGLRVAQAEALALLEQGAVADHVPEDTLELGLLARVQLGEFEQFLDAERVFGLGEETLHILRNVGHERSHDRAPRGPRRK